MSTDLSSASDSEDDLVIVGESTSDGDACESGSSKRETATAEDSESLLKIKASGYYDFLTYDFPRLATLAGSIFCAPATTAGVERFFSVGGYILGIRRTGFLMKTMRVCYLQKLISICMKPNMLLVTSA